MDLPSVVKGDMIYLKDSRFIYMQPQDDPLRWNQFGVNGETVTYNDNDIPSHVAKQQAQDGRSTEASNRSTEHKTMHTITSSHSTASVRYKKATKSRPTHTASSSSSINEVSVQQVFC